MMRIKSSAGAGSGDMQSAHYFKDDLDRFQRSGTFIDPNSREVYHGSSGEQQRDNRDYNSICIMTVDGEEHHLKSEQVSPNQAEINSISKNIMVGIEKMLSIVDQALEHTSINNTHADMINESSQQMTADGHETERVNNRKRYADFFING